MKKLFLPYFSIFLFACNSNAGGPSKMSNDDSLNTSDSKLGKATSMVADAGACSKMIFFQQGAEIEATSYDKDNKERSKQYTKVLSVTNEGGFVVANVEGKDIGVGAGEKPNTVNYNYKCDGNKIYFDLASMFRTASKEKDDSFEASDIEYPIIIKEGETLPDATGTMSSEKNGKKMSIKYYYKDRKVEGREMVTTAAGTWDCYKISNTVVAEMDIPGMDEKSKEMMKKMQESMKTTSINWFAPDLGIVKMELYMNGKLQSRNEVTAIKR